MIPAGLDFNVINRLTGERIGTFDTTCPFCSAFRSSPANRHAKVFRIYRTDSGFAGYHCVHCGESGHARDGHATPLDPEKLAKARADAAERDRKHKSEQLNKACWLWSQRKPITGSIAETYLRTKRGIGCRLPATLGFLPAHGEYPPALIAAVGLPREVEPGVIRIDDAAVRGVHMIRLLPDGSDRERHREAKKTIGHCIGWPIVLAPPNDLLGLAIAEGIENTLIAHEDLGVGAWAAGGASRLPALADRLPDWIDCVSVIADDDPDGRRHAEELAKRIEARGIEAIVTPSGSWRDVA
jgi:Toprim domain